MDVAERDRATVSELAKRHSLPEEAVVAMLEALRRNGGAMAQFNHPDLGGMGQWSSGMTMIGDMFNDGLKAQVNALAVDLAAHLRATDPASAGQPAASDVSYRAGGRSAGWWPSELGAPGSTGAQNNLRYAVFPDKSRLVIDDGGTISIYDTADHQIGGVAQAQGSAATLSFTSQHGLVRVADLKRV